MSIQKNSSIYVTRFTPKPFNYSVKRNGQAVKNEQKKSKTTRDDIYASNPCVSLPNIVFPKAIKLTRPEATKII
eukprot:3783766-Ditylum_brightwellii.AAC.1